MAELDFSQIAQLAANPATSRTVDSIGGVLDKTKSALKTGHDLVDLINSGTNLISAFNDSLSRISALRGLQMGGNAPQNQMGMGQNQFKYSI